MIPIGGDKRVAYWRDAISWRDKSMSFPLIHTHRASGWAFWYIFKRVRAERSAVDAPARKSNEAWWWLARHSCICRHRRRASSGFAGIAMSREANTSCRCALSMTISCGALFLSLSASSCSCIGGANIITCGATWRDGGTRIKEIMTRARQLVLAPSVQQ